MLCLFSACGIGPLPIWFDRQEVMLATEFTCRIECVKEIDSEKWTGRYNCDEEV